MDDKTIFRRAKDRDNPFVMIDKSVFEDTSISWKAKGIMGYLLSRPDDWTVRLKDIANRAADGLHSAKTGLRELEKAGYLTRHVLRDNGRFAGLLVLVHEIPVLEQDRTFQTNNPGVENPPAETPPAENLVTTNTDCTKKENTNSDFSILPSTDNPLSESNLPTEPTNGKRNNLPEGDLLDCALHFATQDELKRPEGWQRVKKPIFEVCELVAELWFGKRMPMLEQGDDKRIKNWQWGAKKLLEYHDGDLEATKATLRGFYAHYVETNSTMALAGPQSLINVVSQFMANESKSVASGPKVIKVGR